MSSIVVERDRSVEMVDGVSLATDVYRPDDDAEHPVLVHRNPYDKSNAKSVGGLVFNPLDAVEEGFVVVVQDVRGRFGSDGEWEPFEHEREDGYETVEWAARQPYSDGHIGIYGASYHGVTALQAAAADPPHLDAVFAYSTGCDYHHGFIYESGAFELGFNLYWALGLTADEERDVDDAALRGALADARTNPRKYAERRPLSSVLPTDDVASYWQEWLDHPKYDEYWKAVDMGPKVTDIDCPVLHLSGWYDVFLQGHLDLERWIRTDGSDPHQFIVGPWNHEAYTTLTPSKVGDRVFGPDAVTGTGLLSDLALDWFDRWLR
jgi:putative CocE/NonD family hydrolase